MQYSPQQGLPLPYMLLWSLVLQKLTPLLRLYSTHTIHRLSLSMCCLRLHKSLMVQRSLWLLGLG